MILHIITHFLRERWQQSPLPSSHIHLCWLGYYNGQVHYIVNVAVISLEWYIWKINRMVTTLINQSLTHSHMYSTAMLACEFKYVCLFEKFLCCMCMTKWPMPSTLECSIRTNSQAKYVMCVIVHVRLLPCLIMSSAHEFHYMYMCTIWQGHFEILSLQLESSFLLNDSLQQNSCALLMIRHGKSLTCTITCIQIIYVTYLACEFACILHSSALGIHHSIT